MADASTNIALTTTSSRHLTEDQKVKLQKATREFESIFVQMLLKSMRGAQGEESSEFGGESYGGGVMKEMFDTELSKHIGGQGKFGIADSLYRKLTGEPLPGLRAQGDGAEKGWAKGPSTHTRGARDVQDAIAARAAAAAQQLDKYADTSRSGITGDGDDADTALLSLTSAMERLQASTDFTVPAAGAAVPQSSSAEPARTKAVPAVQNAVPVQWTSATIQAAAATLPPTPHTGRPALAALTVSAGLTTPAATRDASKTASAAPGKRTSAAFDRVKSYNAIIAATADTVGVDANLLKAMIVEESGGKQHARSPKNAKGLMQLIDSTADMMGVTNVWDPKQNIQGGAKYLKQQLEKFNGDVPLALASYNAGPGNVAKYNGIPPFRETQNYVKRVMNLFTAFQSMERNSDDVIK